MTSQFPPTVHQCLCWTTVWIRRTKLNKGELWQASSSKRLHWQRKHMLEFVIGTGFNWSEWEALFGHPHWFAYAFWEHSLLPCIHHHLCIRPILCYVIICGKEFKGSSKIDFPSPTSVLRASQQLSWGSWAFYATVGTGVDTISFHCWTRDKINSCHLYWIGAEICGLSFLGRLWQLPWRPGNVFIMWLFISFFVATECVCSVCAVVWVCTCDPRY